MNLKEYLEIFSGDEITYKTKYILSNLFKNDEIAKIDEEFPVCTISVRTQEDVQNLAKNAYIQCVGQYKIMLDKITDIR